ncbi:ADP-ribosylglycohydrolase family protein [Sphingomonas alpina]|uniref:ADP-ribosylglycohydrolase family protein n=2 Tax=Sphingomonas alpina TaxID=653931 RepID=A0A7H0LL56_9SPHN|nr:ADP-ribosylglycohydrolase family protein [Sphingomonas alpina]QNQ10409.1 ADP-ribosylglycohydrolase family protein [Sphingomonas alpina]
MTDRLMPSGNAKVALRVGRDRAEAAFLGAAVGDALGWPHEMRAPHSGRNRAPHELRFERWIKRSGGRFQPHEEVIEAGDYSDDTQLILAGARSLLRAPASWWLHFATEELPLWTVYQRGGGGATKRAASSWLAGRSPWDAKPDDADRYFSAGGNGVAMRVLPHCLRRADCPDFSSLAVDIMTDGVTTHGHPRALLGALAYGYGLWRAFRHRGTLSYGQLLDAVRADHAVWGLLPSIEERWPGWADAASRRESYTSLWLETVREQLDLLGQCSDALAGGAAIVDEDALNELGCFDRRINGSGTVNAAAALFLTSRHAADPVEGLMQAALAEGADTDTLASMTGGLLGAALGLEWVLPFARDVQDNDAIRWFADAVRNLTDDYVQEGARHPVTKASLSAFVARLENLREPSSISLPNGLEARAKRWDGVVSKAQSLLASAWELRLEDGQTLFVKKLTRASAQPDRETHSAPELKFEAAGKLAPPLHLGFRLVVSNLARSVAFYQEVVGLPISKRTAKSVNLGGILSIGKAEHMPAVSDHITVFVEVADVLRSLSVYQRLIPDGNCRLEQRDDRIRLQCHDPDGYKIELYQLKHVGLGAD